MQQLGWSWNQHSWVSRSAPRTVWMSRGTDGCELLIITDQPDPAACRMKSTAVSRETVSTFAASSMITKVNGATPKASRQV